MSIAPSVALSMSIAALGACLLALGSFLLPGADGAEQQLSSAWGPVECTYGDVLKPTSVEEVQRTVREARAAGRRVRALGNRHSIHDIICTGGDDGVAIDMGAFAGVEVAADRKSAIVGAGAQLGDVLTALEAEGVTMLAFTQFSELSVGGLMGTGGHSSTFVHPSSLSDQATAMTLVDGRGEVVVATGDLLKSTRLHLGVMGVVLNVTLPVRDLIKLRVETQALGEEVILNGQSIIDRWRTADLLYMFWYPDQKQVLVVEGEAVPFDSPGEAWFPSTFTVPIRDAMLRAHAERDNAFFCDQGTEFLVNFTFTGKFGDLSAVSCNLPGSCAFDTPWQDMSIAVDLADFPSAMRRMRQVLDALATCLPPWLIRLHGASDNHLSIAHGADKAVIDLGFAIPEDPDVPAAFLGVAQAAFQVLTHEFKGVPHWGKNGPAFWSKDFAPAAERFPRLADFLADMRSMDPDGVFQNAFFARALGETGEKLPGCALTAKCVCDVDAHCGSGQACVAPALPDGRDIGLVDLEDSRSKVRVCEFS